MEAKRGLDMKDAPQPQRPERFPRPNETAISLLVLSGKIKKGRGPIWEKEHLVMLPFLRGSERNPRDISAHRFYPVGGDFGFLDEMKEADFVIDFNFSHFPGKNKGKRGFQHHGWHSLSDPSAFR